LSTKDRAPGCYMRTNKIIVSINSIYTGKIPKYNPCLLQGDFSGQEGV